MSALTESRQNRRMKSAYKSKIVSDKIYNMTLGATILYGLIVNVILCIALEDKITKINPIAFIVGYFVCCIIGILMAAKSDNPIISFIGYNLIVIPIGALLSTSIYYYVDAGLTDLIIQAIIITTVITFTMIGLSITFPRFFSGLGKLLFSCLLGLLIASLISMLLFPGMFNILCWLGAILFSLYIGYDYWKAQQYPKTIDNAIDSAVDIYLDIINLFIRILEILAKSKSKK